MLTWRGLVTYYVLFFIHLESRRVSLAGITRHPDEPWMQQMARTATGEGWGFCAQRHACRPVNGKVGRNLWVPKDSQGSREVNTPGVNHTVARLSFGSPKGFGTPGV